MALDIGWARTAACGDRVSPGAAGTTAATGSATGTTTGPARVTTGPTRVAAAPARVATGSASATGSAAIRATRATAGSGAGGARWASIVIGRRCRAPGGRERKRERQDRRGGQER